MALVAACKKRDEVSALRHIEERLINISFVNEEDGDTALIAACCAGMEKVALTLISTGLSKPGHVNKLGYTALIWAAKHGLVATAMALINTGESNSEHIGRFDQTALMVACSKSLPEVALAILDTGKANISNVGYDKETALYEICKLRADDSMRMNSVAEAIINSGALGLDNISIRDETPLICACSYGAVGIALALIKSNQSNPTYVNKYGNSALSISQKLGLHHVVEKLMEFEINSTVVVLDE